MTNSVCPNGRVDDAQAHDFDDVQSRLGGPPVIYCRRCGEVRRLEPEERGVVVPLPPANSSLMGPRP